MVKGGFWREDGGFSCVVFLPGEKVRVGRDLADWSQEVPNDLGDEARPREKDTVPGSDISDRVVQNGL